MAMTPEQNTAYTAVVSALSPALKNTAGDGQAMAAHIRSLGTW